MKLVGSCNTLTFSDNKKNEIDLTLNENTHTWVEFSEHSFEVQILKMSTMYTVVFIGFKILFLYRFTHFFLIHYKY